MVSEIEAATGNVIRTIAVGKLPTGVSSDGTDVWVTNYEEETVSEIEATTGTVIGTIKVGAVPEAVSSDGTHAWVANFLSGTVSEIAIPRKPAAQPGVAPDLIAWLPNREFGLGTAQSGAGAVPAVMVSCAGTMPRNASPCLKIAILQSG